MCNLYSTAHTTWWVLCDSYSTDIDWRTVNVCIHVLVFTLLQNCNIRECQPRRLHLRAFGLLNDMLSNSIQREMTLRRYSITYLGKSVDWHLFVIPTIIIAHNDEPISRVCLGQISRNQVHHECAQLCICMGAVHYCLWPWTNSIHVIVCGFTNWSSILFN